MYRVQNFVLRPCLYRLLPLYCLFLQTRSGPSALVSRHRCHMHGTQAYRGAEMLTNHFLQVQVKSQVSYGCNQRSVICCMPSGHLKHVLCYHHSFIYQHTVSAFIICLAYDHFKQAITITFFFNKTHL